MEAGGEDREVAVDVGIEERARQQRPDQPGQQKVEVAVGERAAPIVAVEATADACGAAEDEEPQCEEAEEEQPPLRGEDRGAEERVGKADEGERERASQEH